jgi:hypothetical protein
MGRRRSTAFHDFDLLVRQAVALVDPTIDLDIDRGFAAVEGASAVEVLFGRDQLAFFVQGQDLLDQRAGSQPSVCKRCWAALTFLDSLMLVRCP